MLAHFSPSLTPFWPYSTPSLLPISPRSLYELMRLHERQRQRKCLALHFKPVQPGNCHLMATANEPPDHRTTKPPKPPTEGD